MSPCADIRRQLLEGDRDAVVGLDAHLQACNACRRLAEAIQAVDHEVSEAVEPILSQPLTRHSPPVPASSPRRFSMAAPALILAAVASITVALWSSPPAPTPPDAAGTATPAPVDAQQAAKDAALEAAVAAKAAKAAAEAAALQAQQARATASRTAPLGVQATGTFLIPWNALSESDWQARASDLLEALHNRREPMDPVLSIQVFAAIGQCAENANSPTAPFYGELGGTHYNLGYAAAAEVALANPGMLAEAELPHDAEQAIAYLVKGFGEKAPNASPRERLLGR